MWKCTTIFINVCKYICLLICTCLSHDVNYVFIFPTCFAPMLETRYVLMGVFLTISYILWIIFMFLSGQHKLSLSLELPCFFLQKSPSVDMRVQPILPTTSPAIVQSQTAVQSNSSDLTSSTIFTPQSPLTSAGSGAARVTSGFPSDGVPPLPSALERTIKIKKGTDQLGEKP